MSSCIRNENKKNKCLRKTRHEIVNCERAHLRRFFFLCLFLCELLTHSLSLSLSVGFIHWLLHSFGSLARSLAQFINVIWSARGACVSLILAIDLVVSYTFCAPIKSSCSSTSERMHAMPLFLHLNVIY